MCAGPFFFFGFIPLAAKIAKHCHRSDPERVEYMTDLELKFKLNFLQIFYPSICAKVFSIFDCIEIPGLAEGDKLRLRADYDVRCWSSVDGHTFYFGWAVFFLIVYVLAFPAGLFVVLYQNRTALFDKSHPSYRRIYKRYRMFYEQYEPEYYWFECLVILRKLMLTGMLSLSKFFFIASSCCIRVLNLFAF
jgi:hypothetical protein